ncbi:hypothetical protein Dxin01_00862 [Deinococcus xinjiangensis]|uniref:Uncharacterized protein n=1 Tax=Deinococcus xinjiangensis TaxID=457454 RepID=A0ABP9V8W0_9DEIO
MSLDSLIGLSQWAAEHGLHDSNARTYAKEGRIPSARRVGRDWVVKANAPLMPPHQPTVAPIWPVTPGQARVRAVVAEYLPVWQAAGRPNLSVNGRYPSWLDELRERLKADPVVRGDEVTGHNLDQPGISATYLSALNDEARRRGCVQRLAHQTFQGPISRVIDTNARNPHADVRLGVKYPTTIGVMLAQLEQLNLGQLPTVTDYQVDVTIFPLSGVVWISSGGAHRTLATMMLGLTDLRVERAAVVGLPVNMALNEAAVRVELFAPQIWLELNEGEYVNLLNLSNQLSLHREGSAADLYDLVAEYLQSRGDRFTSQTPGQILQHFEHLEAYMQRLSAGKFGEMIRGYFRHPMVDQALLPPAQTPIAAWYRGRLERQHERED